MIKVAQLCRLHSALIGPGSCGSVRLRCYVCVKIVTLKVFIVIRSNQRKCNLYHRRLEYYDVI